jgi:DNA-binding beta-propeller fold protein YncE
MQSAISVSVDAHGNVYEADGTGYLRQYSQGSNAPVAGCTPTGATAVSGVAVDAANDVFVSFEAGGIGALAEYPGGFGDCSHEIVLSAPVVYPYGISIDKNKDLIVADAGNAQVDVIDPPYSSVTRTIGSGFLEPSTVTLSRDNKVAFATDYQVHDVFVINYQTGAMITTLGSVYGLADPTAVVDGPNAVY